jgi:hypothetical protein
MKLRSYQTKIISEVIAKWQNWTVDFDAAQKYVSFAALQRKIYQVVKLIRCPDSHRWLVDELCPVL